MKSCSQLILTNVRFISLLSQLSEVTDILMSHVCQTQICENSPPPPLFSPCLSHIQQNPGGNKGLRMQCTDRRFKTGFAPDGLALNVQNPLPCYDNVAIRCPEEKRNSQKAK